MSKAPPPQEAASAVARWAEETADFALVLMSAEARVVWANQALARVLGYTPEDLIGHPLERIFTPEDLERGLAAHEIELARASGRAEDDRWHLGKDGGRVFCNGVLMAMRDVNGQTTGFLKVFRDRTDVRTQTEALENRLGEAVHMSKRKDAFISTLAHELRSPLNAVSNAAELLRRTTDAAQLAKVADIVKKQAATMARLIEDLLDATRLDVGHLKLHVEPVVLQDVIASTVSANADAARARRQELHVVVPEVPITIEADSTRLDQILRNLLENAIKYTPAGGNIWVTATVEGRSAVIRVLDDGDGMSSEALPRIFELFTRDTKALDSATDGLGIGLAVVKNLVHLHHGIIEVQSAGPGRGSEFTVNMPLEQPKF